MLRAAQCNGTKAIDEAKRHPINAYKVHALPTEHFWPLKALISEQLIEAEAKGEPLNQGSKQRVITAFYPAHGPHWLATANDFAQP